MTLMEGQTHGSGGHVRNRAQILIFGPQSLLFDHEAASRLRLHLLHDPNLSWVLHTLQTLGDCWSGLSSAIPILQYLNGEELLQGLAEWVHTGQTTILPWPLPNIILTPLVVVSHLVEFQQWNTHTSNGLLDTKLSVGLDVGSETVGLCTGLLSAVAVSCSGSKEQLQNNWAAAIRLAMLAGAVVDSSDLSLKIPERAKSLSTSWTRPEGDRILGSILDSIPEAYISVIQDKHKVTITTTEATAGALLSSLRARGFAATEIPLRGYFHWQGHMESLKAVLEFCESNSQFRLHEGSEFVLPVRSSATGLHMVARGLHRLIIQSMLVEQSNWLATFTNLQDSWKPLNSVTLTCFGAERCLPTFVTNHVAVRVLRGANAGTSGVETEANRSAVKIPSLKGLGPVDNTSRDHVAVTGMACHLPGAADMEEFWKLLCSGNSQHAVVPLERFEFDTPWRKSDGKRWFGNFVEDHDRFDAKFFKKSPREAASMDPQQRLALQVAYQAVEQAGYLGATDKNIACFIAFGLSDYEGNISCHPANAYTATGNLKAFAAGRISHYFGWTGPSLTIDTACSSSAVAIHLACQSILSGECNAALVGGVNLMTGPDWFHNLAGASFLSPTGQCKPFDASADGYCRGEAVGAVFLKRLPMAVENGDPIFGVIAASAVQQNTNITPITVPNEPSLAHLFQRVTKQAGIAAGDVSYLEAHGTGTPVGDPAEWDSIRRVFGGDVRADGEYLSVGSVKGLVGHSESASGMVALLKVLAMMHHGVLPPQASFNVINPALRAAPADLMEISTVSKPWNARFRAALINNYGASGSNASLLVTEPPSYLPGPQACSPLTEERKCRFPFGIYASDEKALRRYTSKLLSFIKSNDKASPADISCQLARQSNRSLRCLLPVICETAGQLEQKLTAWDMAEAVTVPPPRPVILCFGGQRLPFVGLDKHVYDTAKILRNYLDQCNSVCEGLGTTIYPEIFQKSPIEDTVKLHAALFSLQYACAQSWLSCMPGVEIAGMVGHSFGELTAICISGAVSLDDMLRYLIGRAQLVRDAWGPDKGAMLAVEASLETVESLLAEANVSQQSQDAAASIACFNTPKSFTIAGSTTSIDRVIEAVTSRQAFASIKMKRLDVTNAYHCNLADSVLPNLRKLALDIKFHQQHIHVEHATKHEGHLLGSDLLVNHMRQPVFFSHAVQRLAKRCDSAVWLEIGSNSTVTMMANRALETISPGISANSHFQPVNITGGSSIQDLAGATTALWREGVNVSFWPHHCSQTAEYRRVLLPPYQFEKAKHWMERKKVQLATDPSPEHGFRLNMLLSTVEGRDPLGRSARFRIHADSEKFQSIIKGHVIAQSHPICPSTLQMDLAVEALMIQHPGVANGTHVPRLADIESLAPMPMNPLHDVWLEMNATGAGALSWDWTIFSADNGVKSGPTRLNYAKGNITLLPTSVSNIYNELDTLGPRARRDRCLHLLDGPDVDDVIQGRRHIYRLFSDIVKYDASLQGLQKLVSKGTSESAGRVVLAESEQSWLDYAMTDNFCQVAGIFINTMMENSDDELYISDRIGQLIRFPGRRRAARQPATFDVYAFHERPSNKEFLSNIFIFDGDDGSLVETILGVHYQKTSKAGLSRALARFSGPSACVSNNTTNAGQRQTATPDLRSDEAVISKDLVAGHYDAPNSRMDVSSKSRDIIANLSGLELTEIQDTSQLADLGIDSLMGMELARELEASFSCHIRQSLLFELTDFRSLVHMLEDLLGISKAGGTREVDTVNLEDATSAQVMTGIADHEVRKTIELTPPPGDGPELSVSLVLQEFAECREASDRYIKASGLDGYAKNTLPRSDELCTTYICDAFEQLGCPIRTAIPGQHLPKIEYLPRHEQFVALLYKLLEDQAGFIKRSESGDFIRTAVPAPTIPAQLSLAELNKDAPVYASIHNLTNLVGTRLADCLVGKADAIQLIFGSPEGRELASAMYGQSPINTAWIDQLADLIKQLVCDFPTQGCIRILEMGAGTGGTTARMVPLLESLGVPVTYTVTDISSSLVAGARKRFKQYPFVDYHVLDIEKEPPPEHLSNYHLVLATNCVHATQDLARSTGNIRKMLRPDGCLIMLEMTEPLVWVDLVFGLIDGWWVFNDGRKHALASPEFWDTTLREVGYGRVEWTGGTLPESKIQRLILATATEPSRSAYTPSPTELSCSPGYIEADTSDLEVRRRSIDHYVQQYTAGLSLPTHKNVESGVQRSSPDPGRISAVLVTGATGSLGCHLVWYLASLQSVKMVICLNRLSSVDAQSRQERAFNSRGLALDRNQLEKLRIYQADTSKPLLGLSQQDYDFIARNASHIIHNAWPMSIKRPTSAFESQFKVMRNMIQLAIDAHICQAAPVAFQFISSIGVVGLYPLHTGKSLVPEETVSVDSVLPNGYCDAKLVCELMLAGTLGNLPKRSVTAMSVRIGQIAGSRASGYWNPIEHLAFLIKSSQTIGVLPNLKGSLSWCPVDDVASALGELLIPNPVHADMGDNNDGDHHGIYHIENPVRQDWEEMTRWMSRSLNVNQFVPFDEWLTRVGGPLPVSDSDPGDANPAGRLTDFLEEHFVRMSCGELVLSTERSQAVSQVLRNMGPIDEALLNKYIQGWKEFGFLKG